jgi:hypothetical protein
MVCVVQPWGIGDVFITLGALKEIGFSTNSVVLVRGSVFNSIKQLLYIEKIDCVYPINAWNIARFYLKSNKIFLPENSKYSNKVTRNIPKIYTWKDLLGGNRKESIALSLSSGYLVDGNKVEYASINEVLDISGKNIVINFSSGSGWNKRKRIGKKSEDYIIGILSRDNNISIVFDHSWKPDYANYGVKYIDIKNFFLEENYKNFDVALTVDNGFSHIMGYLTDINMYSFFGPTPDYFHTGSKGQKIVRNFDIKCSPCYKFDSNSACINDNNYICMDVIPPSTLDV